ncbi:related to GRAM domain-containing protein 2 [Rhynchosporium graminicola]|uniref:Related to GRAM domain-containing protein 2 n=1 Tax=Rhynchosporium graminicola TaxID=2792576 RepID=A0A1E1LKS0_9HELO|nr:related to GRAM domain-containing protein 2 [Rhynchosporium commune]
MSFNLERSESPQRSGLAQLFSKNKKKKDRDSAGNSINSSHSALEDTIDRLKRPEVIEIDADPSKIKKLARGLGSKRRRRREEEQQVIEEVARGRQVADRGTLDDNADISPFTEDAPGGDGSSLISYDSEPESSLPTKPSLATHPSHAGYLTSSSPLIQTVTIPESALLTSQLDGTTLRAATFPDIETLAASASTPSLLDSTLRAPKSGSEKRSPSPVGRLKQAFTPKRGSSPNTSPERQSGGGGLGTSKEKSAVDNRRGSVASRIGSIFPEKQAATQPTSVTNSPERPRTAKLQTIDANAPPSTPPPGENPAPIIVNTPPTPTNSSSPRFGHSRERGSSDPIPPNANIVVSPTGNMISHRRIRSGSITLGPSKLSNITSAPLTPTFEIGQNNPGTGQGNGFFSSVFSAAQNAANTLSNSIGNTTVPPGNRTKSGSHELKEPESPIVETFAGKEDLEAPTEEKELAVKTLGMGDLSLSALGISEPSSDSNTPLGIRIPEQARGRSESVNDDRPVAASAANSEFAETTSTAGIDALQPLIRPRSMYEPGIGGDQTPPNGSVFEGKTNIHRSGSIRSAIGHRRTRGSSAATGTTIGAAIAAANNSLSNPSAGAQKTTGFAVASKKRNRDFHQLFRSVPDDDYLIEDYSCALQREILAHGRLYVSEGHLCFSSNIFGWVTTLVMSFDEIVSVEKRSTALLFKNGLMISTLHAKNVFASFTSRDSTYDLIVGIWKLGHPSLRSSLNGVTIEETGGGDKTEKDDGNHAPDSQSGSESGSEEDEDGDDIYDEDEGNEDGMSFIQAEGSVVGSDAEPKVVSRKPSAAVVTNNAPQEKKEEDPKSPGADFPGPVAHAATECTDQETHYAKVIGDEVIQAPLGKIYSLMFGPASIAWMRHWLTIEQKCLELTMADESSKKPLSQENKVRHYSYIKPLNGAIGPRQTKCVCTETLDFLDLEKSMSVTISTQTPDVPSGNVFSTKTKYCLSWAEGNATRLQMNCAIEWTGKSWLKGPIEKGANDGQVLYARDIIASLKTAVSSRRGVLVPSSGNKKGKKGRKGQKLKDMSRTTDGAADSKPAGTDDWGMLEPLHGILGPLASILKPLVTSNIMYGLLVGLLVASWFGFGLPGRKGGRHGGNQPMAYFGTPDRIAAYEEIWRREESELWQWLEDRVGLDGLRDPGQMPIEARTMEGKLKDEKMEEREIEDAIRVTEEKLRVLKEVVGKKKAKVKISEQKADEMET